MCSAECQDGSQPMSRAWHSTDVCPEGCGNAGSGHRDSVCVHTPPREQNLSHTGPQNLPHGNGRREGEED